jgi:predicted DNA-binding transcriptional regulator AlpA
MTIPPKPKLIDRKEVLSRIPVSFPTLWSWMRAGTFPRSRAIGGKSAWLESEVENWITSSPLRTLKGDPPAVTSKQPKKRRQPR